MTNFGYVSIAALGVFFLASALSQQETVEPWSADDAECAVGDEECALSFRQLRGEQRVAGVGAHGFSDDLNLEIPIVASAAKTIAESTPESAGDVGEKDSDASKPSAPKSAGDVSKKDDDTKPSVPKSAGDVSKKDDDTKPSVPKSAGDVGKKDDDTKPSVPKSAGDVSKKDDDTDNTDDDDDKDKTNTDDDDDKDKTNTDDDDDDKHKHKTDDDDKDKTNTDDSDDDSNDSDDDSSDSDDDEEIVKGEFCCQQGQGMGWTDEDDIGASCYPSAKPELYDFCDDKGACDGECNGTWVIGFCAFNATEATEDPCATELNAKGTGYDYTGSPDRAVSGDCASADTCGGAGCNGTWCHYVKNPMY